jgi:hypothetical protein
LAATGQPTFNHDGQASVAFGVWLYNGSNWFPDPTFPGGAACPGSTILWAGKLDYWLIGSSGAPQRTLCRFDGTNLVWEPLPLPAATLQQLPVDTNGNPAGGITAGTCYAWNDCWFFGTDGIEVHWNGQELTNTSIGLGTSPWLQGDFSGAVGATDASGAAFGLVVAWSGMTSGGEPPGARALVKPPAAPNGAAPTQLFGSRGGPFTPLAYTPVVAAPFTADLVAVSADSQGDAWVAADPVAWGVNGRAGLPSAQPAPLDRLTADGQPANCAPGTFTLGPNLTGYTWKGIAAAPDGSAFANVSYLDPAQVFQVGPASGSNPPEAGSQPALVHAVCGQPPTLTEFRRPDPLSADPHLVPADFAGFATAVAAPAPNDAWAATTDGSWTSHEVNNPVGGPTRPHVYQWTDGQAPDAPAGDDSESRPSLFTLDVPVYQLGAPTIVTTPAQQQTQQQRGKGKTVKLKPAIYAVHSRVRPSRGGDYTLYLTFKVRRPVTIGLEALQGRRVVASTGLKRFTGRRGRLVLTLRRARWPTRLRLVVPQTAPERLT